jgi:large exoprotein involved in heme utilization and adhesion
MRRRSNLAVARRRRSNGVARLELVGGQQLVVERGGETDVITLVAPSGDITFSLRVTPGGPVLRFERGLTIEASGELELAGRRVAIRGEDSVSIESGGDAAIEVAGDLSTSARIQNIRARLGNVNVKANDDVKVVGERILLNT